MTVTKNAFMKNVFLPRNGNGQIIYGCLCNKKGWLVNNKNDDDENGKTESD